MSGIFWSGPPSTILTAWQEKRFSLALSINIWDEYTRVAEILSKKYPSVDLSESLDLLASYGKFYEPAPLTKAISADSDDDKFIACAT